MMDVIITTTSETTSLVVPTRALSQPQPALLLKTIELTIEGNLLAIATF